MGLRNISKQSSLYLLGLTFFSSVLFFLPHAIFREILLMITILFIFLPIFYSIYLSKKRSILLVNLLLLGLFLIVFVLSFRNIRDSLPPPKIDETKIVGYTHFFGYPFYLDTVIFFIFILYQPVFFFVLRFTSKIKKKDKKRL